MESRNAALKFASALVWALLGLFLASTSIGDLIGGAYDVVPREKLVVFAFLCLGLILIISAGHYLASDRPTVWIVILASISSAAFFIWLCAGFMDWYFDPMEQGRNKSTLPMAILMGVLCLTSLLPIGLIFAFRRS